MKTTPQILCDIIQNGMNLSNDQIWVYNQRHEIPSDKKLYVVVGLVSAMPYGNTVKVSTAMQDNLYQYMKETLTVDLFSYTQEAQEKYSMVLGSIMSTYSQQQQELLAMKIYPTPVSINDVSHVEGPTLLNRISITLQALRKYSMLLDTEYYDQFELASVDLTE